MNGISRQTLIKAFLESPMSGPEIEARSMEIIDREAPPHRFLPEQWQVVRRMIHTVGDFGIIEAVRFSPDAVGAGVQALRACRSIYTDANMIRAGISLARLRSVCGFYRRESVICHVADQDVARRARRSGLPRSLHAVQKAKPLLEGAIAVIGNAPVALMELSRMIVEEGLRPSLIVALPVGFVHVVESKEELMSLGVPYIMTVGRRGGSPLAVSVIHALCGLAAEAAGGEQP
ncbi:MAG: precorrin-8X methylmutase [Deltaproteobacteria bacterium]|nr:precorrin-8X methylmutase [Deltaproteobacteria bacterium]